MTTEENVDTRQAKEMSRAATSRKGGEVILEIKDLRKYFHTYEGVVRALEGVSLKIHRGETFGLVGESGCGKSVTAMTTMKLTPGGVESGEILYKGKDLVHATEAEMRKLRGNDISMIFQEPMTALNPVYTVGDQIMEVLRLHKKVPVNGNGNGAGFAFLKRKRDSPAWEYAVQKLKDVGIPNPDRVARMHPHELSGGMRQRVMIAMMMACEPDLLIADEPTTALDVTIQAQILELMKDMQLRKQTAIWMITHDLGVVAEMCDVVAVMYAGYIVEYGTVDQIFSEPRMPYTIGLMHAIPKIGLKADRLPIIPGKVPNLLDPPTGCRFHPRCPLATDVCKEQVPALEDVGDGHLVACHHKDRTTGGRLRGRTFDDKTRELEETGREIAG